MPINTIIYSTCLSLIFVAMVQSGSCRGEKAASVDINRVANGVWGGQEIRLNVTDQGADLEFSCARGHIDEPLALNSSGHFSARGTFTRGSMGPTREDDPPKPQPAVFSGEVHEKNMSLKMTLTNTKETQDFTLEFGSTGRIHPCH